MSDAQQSQCLRAPVRQRDDFLHIRPLFGHKLSLRRRRGELEILMIVRGHGRRLDACARWYTLGSTVSARGCATLFDSPPSWLRAGAGTAPCRQMFMMTVATRATWGCRSMDSRAESHPRPSATDDVFVFLSQKKERERDKVADATRACFLYQRTRTPLVDVSVAMYASSFSLLCSARPLPLGRPSAFAILI